MVRKTDGSGQRSFYENGQPVAFEETKVGNDVVQNNGGQLYVTGFEGMPHEAQQVGHDHDQKTHRERVELEHGDFGKIKSGKDGKITTLPAR